MPTRLNHCEITKLSQLKVGSIYKLEHLTFGITYTQIMHLDRNYLIELNTGCGIIKHDKSVLNLNKNAEITITLCPKNELEYAKELLNAKKVELL